MSPPTMVSLAAKFMHFEKINKKIPSFISKSLQGVEKTCDLQNGKLEKT